MEYIDLRKVGRDGLREIHRQIVRLKKLGKTGKEISVQKQKMPRSIGQMRPESAAVKS